MRASRTISVTATPATPTRNNAAPRSSASTRRRASTSATSSIGLAHADWPTRLISDAYGKAPTRSYFGGCSNGGRAHDGAAARFADRVRRLPRRRPGLPPAAGRGWPTWNTQQFANAARAQGFFETTRPGAGVTRCSTPRSSRRNGRPLPRHPGQVRRGSTAGRRPGPDTGAASGVRPEPRRPDLHRRAATAPACTATAQKTSSAAREFGRDVAYEHRPRSIYAQLADTAGSPGTRGNTRPGTSPAINVGARRRRRPVHLHGPADDRAGHCQRRWCFPSPSTVDTTLAKIQATNATYPRHSLQFMTPPNSTDLSTLKNQRRAR